MALTETELAEIETGLYGALLTPFWEPIVKRQLLLCQSLREAWAERDAVHAAAKRLELLRDPPAPVTSSDSIYRCTPCNEVVTDCDYAWIIVGDRIFRLRLQMPMETNDDRTKDR